MKTETRSRRGWWKVAACVLLAAVLAAAGFFWYVSDYYRADEIALEVLAQDSGVTVQDDLTVLSPSYPTDTGLIFYPGAKVEGAAYLPLLDRLRQTGLTCVLVEMPFHLAIFDADAAEDVMEQFPDIQHWYIAGHSLGGAMASQFAADHPDEIDGLILLGALPLRRLPARRHPHRLRLPEPERGGQNRLHRERGGDPGRQPRPVRQLRPPEGGRARHHLSRGTAGPDDGGRGGFHRPAAGMNAEVVGRFEGFCGRKRVKWNIRKK